MHPSGDVTTRAGRSSMGSSGRALISLAVPVAAKFGSCRQAKSPEVDEQWSFNLAWRPLLTSNGLLAPSAFSQTTPARLRATVRRFRCSVPS
jgi:hypothetical protein